MERRRFPRFLVDLKAKAGQKVKESSLGLIRDFSRDGLRAIFEKDEFGLDSPLELEIQMPGSEVFIPANVVPVWKRLVEGKWNLGFRLMEFPLARKAEILEYGYRRWVKEHIPSSV